MFGASSDKSRSRSGGLIGRLRLAKPNKRSAKSRRFAGWRRFVPETVIMIGVMVAVDAMFFGGRRFIDIQPHPFWIPILLVAVQYGVGGGLFAALVASIALYAGAMPQRAEGVDFYSYVGVLAGQPAAWLCIASIIGCLRTVHLQQSASLARRLSESEQQRATVTEGFSRSLKEVTLLEQRLAADTATVDAVLYGLAQTDPATPASFLRSSGELVRELLGASAYAVYLRVPEGLELAFTEDEDGEPGPQRNLIPFASQTMRVLEHKGFAVSRSDEQHSQWLPLGALAIAAIRSRRTGELHGAIIVDRLRDGDVPVSRLVERMTRLAGALAAILDCISAEHDASGKSSEVFGGKISA